jgi:hypothetical protein
VFRYCSKNIGFFPFAAADMKKHWIEYSQRWRPSSMSYWVHVETDDRPWFTSTSFDPPLPGPIAGKGYPQYFVEFDGYTFEFASLDEIRVCIATLGQKLLPTTIRLSQQRGGDLGPSSHWLSRLSPKTKPWRYRERAVAYLQKSLESFQCEVL